VTLKPGDLVRKARCFNGVESVDYAFVISVDAAGVPSGVRYVQGPLVLPFRGGGSGYGVMSDWATPADEPDELLYVAGVRAHERLAAAQRQVRCAEEDIAAISRVRGVLAEMREVP